MDKAEALAKWKALRRMTVERGATVHEARTAKRLANALANKYGLAEELNRERFREQWDERWARAVARAVLRYRWEYRRCGKARCHCMRGGSPHGPYLYRKVREGKLVRSVYGGR